MPQIFLNNFQTQFLADVRSLPQTNDPATELDYGVLRVSDGAAGTLLNPGAGHWYVLTAFKRSGSLETNHEIMRVTAVDNSVVGECRITVLRGQEGMAPQAFARGDLLECRLTAGGMGEHVQASDPRLSDSRAPGGPAGGVLSGQFPNPGFANPMATAAELSAGLAGKVDKVAGKGLSANDFTNDQVAKLDGVAAQATKNATDAQLRDRATHTGTQAIGTVAGLQAALDGKQNTGEGGASAIGYKNLTAAYSLAAIDRGVLLDCSGSWTLGFAAAATLGAGWWCYLRNIGSGTVTADPNGAELIDGVTSGPIMPGMTLLIQCDGSAFRCIRVGPMVRTEVLTSGTSKVVPLGVRSLRFRGVGGGGGGGRYNGSDRYGAPGGSGGYFEGIVAVNPGDTLGYAIGAGGSGAAAVDQSGTAGGQTSLVIRGTTYQGNGGDGGLYAPTVTNGGTALNAALTMQGGLGISTVIGQYGVGIGGSNPLGQGAARNQTSTGYGSGGTGGDAGNQSLSGRPGAIVLEY